MRDELQWLTVTAALDNVEVTSANMQCMVQELQQKDLVNRQTVTFLNVDRAKMEDIATKTTELLQAIHRQLKILWGVPSALRNLPVEQYVLKAKVNLDKTFKVSTTCCRWW